MIYFYLRNITQAVLDALKERDYENGQVSREKLKEILISFQSEIISSLHHETSQLNTRQDKLRNTTDFSFTAANVAKDGTPTYCGGKYTPFCYNEGESLRH